MGGTLGSIQAGVLCWISGLPSAAPIAKCCFNECRQALNGDLPPDLYDRIGREEEEIADMDHVAFHEVEQRFLPSGQPLAVVAMQDSFLADRISNIGKIDPAANVHAQAQAEAARPAVP
jgi:hypothetical protein